jgi:XTP/dITP diphosphohydrolase
VVRLRATLVSKNAHKAGELAVLMPGWAVEPIDVDELPEETGETFYENARAKAAFGREVDGGQTWTIGEDSGVEVDGLDGRPGIRSARYAGLNATDDENVTKLLAELDGVAGPARRARYVSELVCFSPSGEEFRGSGMLEGRIGTERRGSEGFGYDPVFIPDGEARTVAELGNAWKAERSHRAAAAASLLKAVGSATPAR